MKVILWFSDVMKEMTVDVPQLPQRGDMFNIDHEDYVVTHLIFGVQDYRPNDADHLHRCEIKATISPYSTIQPAEVNLPKEVSKPRQERGQ